VKCGAMVKAKDRCFVCGTVYCKECAGQVKLPVVPRPGCQVKCHLDAKGPRWFTLTRILGQDRYRVVDQPTAPPEYEVAGCTILEVRE